ncbi:uncharacterized protein LOC128869270 isoform X1 [Anastrepha ludens]|uniref:uncharacterized protein LOC128869270 isoform X1 n=1 Tax=Anastrepha ludens TaxID=28586 RepID=UPI0023B1660E|nr:uncharacterized protein LOC128869270 isoform X1 [Anastrepha ludens]
MHLVSAAVAAFINTMQNVNGTPSIKMEDLILNRTTLHSMRRDYCRRQAQEIINGFNIPDVFVLHWDSKLLAEIRGTEKKDRLSLVVTGENMEKLLGIPKIESSTGDARAAEIHNFLCKWKLNDLVEIVSFDTTAANNGAAFLLEKRLGRNLLLFPCRHHVSELLVKAVFELNFGKSSAPEVPLFNRFSNSWKNINSKSFKSGISENEVRKVFTIAEVEIFKNFCLTALNSHHTCANYKELLQLSLLFVGEDVPNFSQVRSPGATSHARFMSKCLYCYKMFLFREQFVLTTSEIKSLRSVCIFLTCIYVPYWFRCVDPIAAPQNDLKLIQDVIVYFDKNVSNAWLHKIKNHLCYLSEEADGLSFFDGPIHSHSKRKMVEAITSDNQKEDAIPKRVVATMSEITLYGSKNINDFISSRTKTFFTRLGIETSFLESDPSTWQESEGYIAGKRICQLLSVVNDAAERALKLITDYNRSLTYNEEEEQYLLQVVEHYRQWHPSYTKTSLIK